MTYTLTPKDGCWQELSGTVPQDQVAAEYKHALKEISAEVRLPGFRPGKAPAEVVKARFADDIKRHCIEHLVGHVVEKELTSRQLAPVDYPKLESIDWDGTPGGAFKFAVKFESAPKIEPKGLESLTAPDLPAALTDAELDEAMESLRRRRARLNALEGTIAAAGHVVVAELSGSEKGNADHALPPKDHFVKIPSGSGKPGDGDPLVGPHLLGVKADDSKIFEMAYPQEGPPELAGKVFIMTAKIKKLYSEEVPALDEAFAKELKCDSVAALREKVKIEVGAEKADAVRGAQQGEILHQLREANPAPLPEAMVSRETQARLQQVARTLAARGINPADAKDQLDELIAREAQSARIAVHNTLLLDAIAESEGIYAGEEGVEQAVAERAAQQGKSAALVRAELAKSGELEELGVSVRREQTLLHLVAKAKKVAPKPGK
jgi:trigger factor